MTRPSSVARLRREVVRVIGDILPPGEPPALLDFPAYGNVGDSAIWLGELACLEALGCPEPSYTCDLGTYDRDTLARRVAGGPIWFSGGGNFGDLYPLHQRFREQVVADFPRNPIVQLPCSIHFQDRRALDRARRIYGRHPEMTLLARDEVSREVMRAEFGNRVALCPDMALCLATRSLRSRRTPNDDVLWLLRGDDEGRSEPGGGVRDAPPADWTAEPRPWWKWVRRAGEWLAGGSTAGVVRRTVSATYPLLARKRVTAGVRLLSSARVIVTDRLHGHILCLLLGIPHVLLDTRHGKNSSYFQTWTSDHPGAHLADSKPAAGEIAAALLGSLPDRTSCA
ncbi:MAG: polysaccharide pyruvyl transferase family protein [Longimicrobiaceae bacterium]